MGCTLPTRYIESNSIFFLKRAKLIKMKNKQRKKKYWVVGAINFILTVCVIEDCVNFLYKNYGKYYDKFTYICEISSANNLK